MYSGRNLWTNLPLRIKTLPDHKAFKKAFKQFLMGKKSQQTLTKDMRTISFLLAFVYVLNIYEYNVSDMFVIYTCMVCILLSLSLSHTHTHTHTHTHSKKKKKKKRQKEERKRKKKEKNAYNFIFTHQQGLVVRFLTEPKLQSL